MIKIYKDFFDSDCLKYIEEQIEKSKNTASLRTSYPTNNWNPHIIHESTPVMIYDMFDFDILLERFKEIIDISDDKIPLVGMMIYYWPIGSYIPWHNDDHVNLTATLYCNRFWHKDWGGLFLYEEGDKVLVEFPEWNKLVVQIDECMHSTTPVTRPYYYPINWETLSISTEEQQDNLVPIIRTTIQIFMKF